jgi:hypothetical protein
MIAVDGDTKCSWMVTNIHLGWANARVANAKNKKKCQRSHHSDAAARPDANNGGGFP